MIDYNRVWAEWGDMSRNAPTPTHTRRLILQEAEQLRFASALDVGCGIGVLIDRIHRRYPGCRCVGTDISGTALERARNAASGISFRELDVQKQALDETFDLVLCSEVIEHLEEPAAAVRNLRRMCSGYLILTTPTGDRLPTDLAFHHLKHFAPEELRALVEEGGFSVLRLYRWGWPFQVLFRSLINLVPGLAHDTFVKGGNYGLVKKTASAIWNVLFYLNLRGKGTQLVLVAKAR